MSELDTCFDWFFIILICTAFSLIIIGMILSIVDSFTEVVSCIRLRWDTFTRGEQSSYLRLKRIKFFDYYYIEEEDDDKDCKSHPSYKDSIKKLKEIQTKHKKDNLDKLW